MKIVLGKKIRLVLIHTWKGKGTESLSSFVKYVRHHSWQADQALWKAAQGCSLPSPRAQVCLQSDHTAQDGELHFNLQPTEPLRSPLLASREQSPCSQSDAGPHQHSSHPLAARVCASTRVLRSVFQEAQPGWGHRAAWPREQGNTIH